MLNENPLHPQLNDIQANATKSFYLQHWDPHCTCFHFSLLRTLKFLNLESVKIFSIAEETTTHMSHIISRNTCSRCHWRWKVMCNFQHFSPSACDASSLILHVEVSSETWPNENFGFLFGIACMHGKQVHIIDMTCPHRRKPFAKLQEIGPRGKCWQPALRAEKGWGMSGEIKCLWQTCRCHSTKKHRGWTEQSEIKNYCFALHKDKLFWTVGMLLVLSHLWKAKSSENWEHVAKKRKRLIVRKTVQFPFSHFSPRLFYVFFFSLNARNLLPKRYN